MSKLTITCLSGAIVVRNAMFADPGEAAPELAAGESLAIEIAAALPQALLDDAAKLPRGAEPPASLKEALTAFIDKAMRADLSAPNIGSASLAHRESTPARFSVTVDAGICIARRYNPLSQAVQQWGREAAVGGEYEGPDGEATTAAWSVLIGLPGTVWEFDAIETNAQTVAFYA